MICYKLSTVERTFLKKLQTINWQTIRHNLLNSDEGREFTLTQAAHAIWRYGLFLLLAQKYPGMRLVPSKEIDAVLHAHIATDHQYQEDCQNLFGVFLDHSPGFGTKGDRKEWLLAFAGTKQLFEKSFGWAAMGDSAAASCEILLSKT